MSIRNIIIGIDGGSFDYIRFGIKKGLLPTFKKILNDGFYSNLQVTIPPVTIPSFPCLFSGLEVTDLGYCTFYDPTFGVFSSNLWKEKSIFNFDNIRIFCLNLPSTYPAWEINGEMITGLLTPFINDKMYYPKNLSDIIKQNWIIDGSNIYEIFKAFNIKSSILLSKLGENFDLLIYIIRIPDCITHHPKYKLKITEELIKYGYSKIDNFLAKILNSKEFDNLFIISDHGLEIYHYEFNIKRFLEKKKILFYNNDIISKFMSIFIKIFGIFNRGIFDTTYFHNQFKRVIDPIRKIFIKSSEANNTLQNTRFVHFYSNFGGIYLNKEDKVSIDKIKVVLQNCKYVKKIIQFNRSTLPDLIIILKEKYLFSVKSSFFVRNRFNSFNHSENGIFIAYGKNIQKGRDIIVSYKDFAPTLLKLHNIKTPNHMKGKVLSIFKS
ncbi:MAG: alkaline phosphatase family protein [Candidatus Thorarchaeota archaeon]